MDEETGNAAAARVADEATGSCKSSLFPTLRAGTRLVREMHEQIQRIKDGVETPCPPSHQGSCEAPCERAQPRFRITFRRALLCNIITSTLISSAGLFLMSSFDRKEHTFRERVRSTRRKLDHAKMELIRDHTSAVFDSVLSTVAHGLDRHVKDNANDAVDTIWINMQTQHLLNSSWDGKSPHERMTLINHSYLGLLYNWKGAQVNPHERGIRVSWASGEEAGASIVHRSGSGGGNATRSVFAYDMPGPGSNRTQWEVELDSGQRAGSPLASRPHNMSEQPAFRLQARWAERARSRPGGAAQEPQRRMWTDQFAFQDGMLGLSLTAPIAYCQNYACFDGVIEVAITLAYVSFYCADQWRQLRAGFDFSISSATSTVFIVNHVAGRSPEQQGLLVAASHASVGARTQATEAQSQILRLASLAILAKFRAWNATELLWDQTFTFRPLAGGQVKIDDRPFCAHDESLLVAGMRSVMLDAETRWLVVIVLPHTLFSKQVMDASRKLDASVAALKDQLMETEWNRKIAIFCTLLGAVAFSGLLTIVLSLMVSSRLRQLGDLMGRLGDLDPARNSPELLVKLKRGHRSHIAEVGDLQGTFCQLSRGVEAFMRFVPEAVVQGIVRGDPGFGGLHVSRREVTIMFTDIRDFTDISESLSDRALLFLLTSYFTVMTRIIESTGGVVAEILGDGLLVFWNTPGDVQHHAAKACEAAISQQEALVLLNAEFRKLGLPQLAIRIGLHTGLVLSGNIGSHKKMKFGCMGDAVNIASRLEGLCKFYGISVICSAATHAGLPPDSGIICRRLDLVQLKGKREPTSIYEVMARESASGPEVEASGDMLEEADEGDGSGLWVSRIGSIRSKVGRSLSGTPAANGGGPEGCDDDTPSGAWVSRVGSTRSKVRGQFSGGGLSMTPASFRCIFEAAAQSVPALAPVDPAPAAEAAAEAAATSQEQLARARQYEEALDCYQAADFASARSLARRLLEAHPSDGPAANLLGRASRRALEPPTGDELARWTGVVVMTGK